MRRCVYAALAGCATLAFGQTPAPKPGGIVVGADQSGSLNELYKKSMEQFAKGEFAEAATGLKDMLDQGAEGAGLESIYFTIAAAWFNLKDHKKALDSFQDYIKRFPNGGKVADALMGIGQSQLALGDKAAALQTFAEAAKKPAANKDQALLMRAALLRETGKEEEALALLRPAVTGSLQNDDLVQQACLLASLEAASGSAESAIKILSFLQARLETLDNPLQVNSLAFEVGDALLNKKAVREALRAYALVRRKGEVIALQRSKLEGMARLHARNMEAIRAMPSRIPELQSANAALSAAFEQGKKVLEQVAKAEEFMIPLRLRQARAYQELGRHWECVLVLETLLTAGVSDGVREEVLFAICVSHSELQNIQDLETVAGRYLSEFPTGKNAEAVEFMRGVLALQRNDFTGAESIFGRMIGKYSAGDKIASTLFLLGNTRFASAKYAAALEVYEDYAKRFPKGEFFEEVRYRRALCYFFAGDYAKSHPALEQYVKEFPEGVFVADAFYRIAVCYQAAGEYKDVLKRCADWERDFSGHSLTPEVFSLLGDALAALERREDAAAAYEKALENNPSEQVLGYVLFEANKLYQKLGRWDKSVALLRNFLQSHPGHPSEVTAVFWLSKAMVKEGKQEEAKQFVAQKIAASIGDRASDGVEQLITQLVQLCAKRPPPSQKPSDSREVARSPGNSDPTQSFPQDKEPAVTSEPPPPPPYDPAAEMQRCLAVVQVGEQPLPKARLFFAQSELARLTRKPQEALKWLDKIADEIAPSALGAGLLAQIGDRLLERGEHEKGREAYSELMKAFPKSELLDFAYNGFGQMELGKGNYKEALQWFVDAVEKAGASLKLKDVTLGQAKALLGLGRLDEARPIFEQVGAAREWRGEATAEAVFSLGEVAFLKQDYAAAVQFFQRVFVAYQRYPAVVARSYLRAADCFEKMGEPEKALTHLREMISRDKLGNFPEVAVARKRMEGFLKK